MADAKGQRFISHHCEVLDALSRIETDSVDAILSDFPYGFGPNQPTLEELLRYLGGEQLDTGGDFMGADWHVPSVPTWREMLRVLRPGGYLLGFGGPRTIDLISLGARAAGFAIRDVITYAWMFGSGFPKAQNAGKALDDAAGAVRTEPVTAAAATYEGYATALKPAFEPVLLARKPLVGTLAENIALHGTGALAIDASRIATDWSERSEAWKRSGHSAKPDAEKIAAPAGNGIDCHPAGRWPANVALDEAAAAALDAQTGTLVSGGTSGRAYVYDHDKNQNVYGAMGNKTSALIADAGGASRFFYVAKASREERDLGCKSVPRGRSAESSDFPKTGAARNARTWGRNTHPNVKPVQLTKWLAGLILPPPSDGRVRRILVPYAGSGSEMIGALLAGWDLVEGIEREPRPNIPGAPDYQAILRARVQLALKNPRAFEPEAERKGLAVDERQIGLFGETG